jgi:hypothetical protein
MNYEWEVMNDQIDHDIFMDRPANTSTTWDLEHRN